MVAVTSAVAVTVAVVRREGALEVVKSEGSSFRNSHLGPAKTGVKKGKG